VTAKYFLQANRPNNSVKALKAFISNTEIRKSVWCL